MKTPKDFDYDIWKDDDGHYFIRVKRTGEVARVSEEVVRELWLELYRMDKYRKDTTITDEDGKRSSLYAETPELLYQKVKEAKREIAEIKFRRENPTVREYREKWLTMQSAVIRDITLNEYRQTMQKYIVDKIGDMYLDEVTADDLKLLMVPASKMSSALYGKVNMLVKCVFYSAERSHLIEYNPSAQISAKGGTPTRKKDALSDEQKNILLDTVRDLPPYVFVMLGLYSGLRREEILGLQWDCVFLEAKVPYISVRGA